MRDVSFLLTRDWEKNNKKYFQCIEIGNILIYINIKRVLQMKIDYTHYYWNPKMLEYNLKQRLNKCMYAVTRHIFITFPISKELYLFFLKNWQTRPFKLYEALFIYKNLAADDYAYLGWGWSKIWLFRTRADFSVIINISIKTLWPRAIFMLFLPFLYFQFLSSYNGFSLFFSPWSIFINV